jgi:hypothetical protein
MQNLALWGFSAEQLWQRINAPVDYATPCPHQKFRLDGI